MKTIKYALRIKNTDVLLKLTVVEIKDNEEKNKIFVLGKEGTEDWLLDDPEEVKEALNSRRDWYESDLKHPYTTLSKEELEVVEVSEIKRIEAYAPRSIYEDLDSYHRQKVEEALQRHTIESKKKTELSTKEEPSNDQENLVEETIEFYSPAPNEKMHVATVSERKTIKAKVKCVRSIPKEMGSVRLKSDPVSYCFKEGKHYLAYVKQEKLFIMNEDKVPEFICNAPAEEQWEQNIFFERHFVIEEYLN